MQFQRERRPISRNAQIVKWHVQKCKFVKTVFCKNVDNHKPALTPGQK
jgi:hypothetical protein